MRKNKRNYLSKIITFSFMILISQTYIPCTPNKGTQYQNYSLLKEGKELRKNGEFLKSIEIFTQSIETTKKRNDNEKLCDTYIELGFLYWNVGDLSKSKVFFSKGLEIANEFSFKQEKMKCEIALKIYNFYQEGKKSRKSGQFDESINNFQNAIKLAQEIESKEHEIKCMRQLSATFLRINDLQQFYSLNERALKIAQDINHRKEEGSCLNNIGIYHKKLDNYSKALSYYEEALKIAKLDNNKELMAERLNNIGIVYQELGFYGKSIEYLIKALNIDKQLGNDIFVSMDLNNIGETFRNKGIISNKKEDLLTALDYFEKCHKLILKTGDKRMEAMVLNNIGTVQSDLKNYQEALKYFQLGLKKAEDINDVESMGMILNNIGIVYYNQEDYEESTKYYQRAINLALQIQGNQILWEAYLEQAKALSKQDKLKQALASYKNSIAIIEDIRSQIKLEELKASYLGSDNRMEAYHNLIDLLITLHKSEEERGYDQEAFDYLERAKARAFLDRLEISQLDISQGIDPRLLNKEKELMKDISKLYTKLYNSDFTSQEATQIHEELKEYEDKLESLKREIRTLSPAYADLKYPEIITLEETQKELLDDQSAFFAYSIGKENSYLFVITKNNLKIFPVPNREALQHQISEYLKTITDKDNNIFQLGYELYAALVKPGLTAEMKNLIFIPDDILHFLPFEALITHEKSKNWLIQDYQIAYIPSLSSYREILNRKNSNNETPNKDILAFGDPSFGSLEMEENGGDVFQDFFSSTAFNFSRLSYSDYEIQKISSLFDETKTIIFTRESASEEELKNHNLEDYKIIHFATHSLIDDKRPARSSIVLTLDDEPSEDGFLQMREVYNLKLNSELVVLSACQTGLGQLINGEGIEGLNRAFFYAGASSVLMSLWSVNDQASSQLMERFYSHLRSSESSMNALRKTKLEMISSGVLSHPYYWAGFIVSGKADEAILRSSTKRYVLFGFLILLGSGIILFITRKIFR